MQRLTIWAIAVLLVCATPAFAGHSLNSPVSTTGPGDFYCLGNADFDGTVLFDGICTFNATPVFTLDVSVGDDLAVTDSLYVGGNAAVTDTLTVGGALKGGRVFLHCGSHLTNHTADAYLDIGGGSVQMYSTNSRGYPTPRAGSVLGVAMRAYIDSYTPGATLAATVYVNTGAVYTTTWTVDGTGAKSWYGTQPRGVDTFVAGDVFSVLIDVTGTVQFDLPCATVDLQLDN